jgi:hypothetical protein
VIHLPTRIAREAAPDLSRAARARLEMLEWHDRHGRNVSRTARHFGYSCPTVYRWLARDDRHRLETLEDRPSGPRRRRPTWTLAELAAVRRARRAYPRWGRTTGRAPPGGARALGLDDRAHPRAAPAHGELREPAGRRISARKRA